MSTTLVNPPAVLDRETARRPHLLRTGTIAGLGASFATCLVVVVARWAGEDVAIAGERIPLNGFVTLTMLGAVIGVGLAAMFARKATHPRALFVRSAVVLTALSIVPDVVVDAPISTKVLLATTHLVAAAIIVPALAWRLAD